MAAHPIWFSLMRVRAPSSPPFLQPLGCGCRKKATSLLFTNQAGAKGHRRVKPRDFLFLVSDAVIVWRCLLIPKTLAATDNGRQQCRPSPSKKPSKMIIMKKRVLLRLGWPAGLTAVFAVLKWCKVITWSWWWVTSPLWMLAAFWAVVLIIVSVFGWIYNSKK